MDSIPLLDYILGSKMLSRAGAVGPTTRIRGEESDAAAIGPSPSDEKRAKRDILSMVNNVIAKIMEDGFVHGSGHMQLWMNRYEWWCQSRWVGRKSICPKT